MKNTANFIALMILASVSSFANPTSLVDASGNVLGTVTLTSTSATFDLTTPLSPSSGANVMDIFLYVNPADVTGNGSTFATLESGGLTLDQFFFGTWNWPGEYMNFAGVLINEGSTPVSDFTVDFDASDLMTNIDNVAVKYPEGVGFGTASIDTAGSAAPEPASIALIGLGIAGVSLLKNRKFVG